MVGREPVSKQTPGMAEVEACKMPASSASTAGLALPNVYVVFELKLAAEQAVKTTIKADIILNEINEALLERVTLFLLWVSQFDIQR